MPRFPVFSSAETESFRAAINKYRAPGSYEAGKWSVSPLNRRPEIVGEFPEKVVLRDIALRTTDQMPGVVLAPADRLRFMRAIAETGVPSLLIGVFGRRSADEVRAEVKLIKSINPRLRNRLRRASPSRRSRVRRGGGSRHRAVLGGAVRRSGADVRGARRLRQGVARPGLARRRGREHRRRADPARRSSSSSGATSRASRCRRESISSPSRRKATSSRSVGRCIRCAPPRSCSTTAAAA